MMKTLIRKIGSLVLMVGVLAGCAGTSLENSTNTLESVSPASDIEKAPWPRTIVDAMGNENIFEKKPERIAILHAMYLDYFFLLGAPPTASAGATIGDAMKAMEEFETLKPYAGTAEIIDLGSARDINLEAILQSNPDVIVTFGGHIDKIYDELIKIAPVIQLEIEDTWQNTTMRCAEIVGKEELASEFIAETEKIISETNQKLEAHKDETFAMLRIDGKGNFVAPGSITALYYDQTEGFGLTAPKGYPVEGAVLSLEALAEMNPDYIVFQHFVEVAQKAVEAEQSSEVWQSLDAVKNGNILFFDDSLNTRSPLALRIAAKGFLEAVEK